MVKLQKRLAYKYKAKDGERVHYKHVVTIPAEIMEELGWKEGSELAHQIQNGRLIMFVKSKREL